MMNRQQFLDTLVGVKAERRQSLTSGLTAYNGPWTTREVTHLLRRTMFGARQTDISYFVEKTMSETVDELLLPALAPTPPVNEYNNTTFTDPVVPLGQPWISAPIDYVTPLVQSKRLESLYRWWLGQMVHQNRSIHQKLTLFWSNHFVVEFKNVNTAQYLYRYYDTLFQYALGDFRAMTKDISLSVAMLKYLNGNQNSKSAPDENYARELQELFTVGKGPDSFYTESDVKAAAKILTGYRVDAATFSSYFDSTKHDTTNKQFSAFYNNTLIAGQSGAAGETELDALLAMLYANPETARHICRRLYMFFVYYEIDAAVEANVIIPLADVLRNNQYDISAALRVLLKSEHFYDVLSRGCLIKNPLDFFIGMIREMEVQQATDVTQLRAQQNYYRTTLVDLGMMPGIAPNVAGWFAYYMAPSFHEIWINADTLTRRLELIQTLTGAGNKASGFTTIVDGVSFAARLPNAEDPNTLVADAVALLYPFDVSQSSKDFFKTFLLTGQTDDVYWSSAWLDYIADPTDPTARNTVQTRLQALFQTMFSQAEYHLS